MRLKSAVAYTPLIASIALTITACLTSGGGTSKLIFEPINDGAAYRVDSGTMIISNAILNEDIVRRVDDWRIRGAVIIPAIYNGKPVTEIGEHAFQGYSRLTSVTIPASVTAIGRHAFYYCIRLRTVTFTDDSQLQSIGAAAFDHCWNLTSIAIPASVTEIDDDAFSSCINLVGITIPASVTEIGNRAFSSCSNLVGITIPASITEIGNGAFSGSPRLTSIMVDTNNQHYSNEGGILYNKAKTELIAYPSAAGNIAISADVMAIGNSAFAESYNLVTVTFTDDSQLQSIGAAAFAHCWNLTSVTIPASVTSIGNYVFNDCGYLISITVDENNQHYSSEDGILYNKAKTEIIDIPRNISGHVTIPEGITEIGYNAFSWHTRLTSITIPATVTKIGMGAFSYCNLTSITIPASVTEMGQFVFRNWTDKQTINVPFANQGAADAVWGTNWRDDIYNNTLRRISARIVYQGGN